MKKFYFLAFALVAFIGCSKEVAINEDVDSTNEEVKYISFTSSVENPIMDDQTKATLGKDGVFSWAEDDEVKFYKEDGTAVIGKVQSDLETIIVADGDYVSAVYPASVGSGKYSVNFNTVGPIVVAKVTKGSPLNFYHLGSMMTINVASVPEACKLEIKANGFSGSDNDGSYTFNGSGVPSLTNSTPSLSVVDVAAGNTGNITVAVANYNYASGFTLGLKNAGGRYLYKKSTAKSFNLSTRATLLNMKALTYVPSSMYYISTESSRVSNTTTIPLIQTSSSPDIYEVAMNSDNGVSYSIFDSYNVGNASGAIISGTTDAESGASSSAWKVVGQVNGNDWTIDDKLVDMSYVGNWHFVRNVLFDATSPEFKFFENPSDWDANSYKGDGSSISVGDEGTIVSGKGDPNIKIASVSTSTYYDIFVNFASNKVIVKLSSDNYFPNVDGFFVFTYNKTAGTTSSTRGSELITYPFNVNDPDMTGKMNIIGDFTSWSDQLMSYNNNHGWTTSITIATDDTYKFDFRETNTWGWYRWSDSRTASSLFGYSGWQSGGDTGCTINLTAGTYDVYVNAYSYYDNKAIKYSFVKR